MNERTRKDSARILRRRLKDHLDDDHGRYGVHWSQRFGGRLKKAADE